jgi:hypothetical protein
LLHDLFTVGAPEFISGSRGNRDADGMGDLASVLGTVTFVVAMLALVWGLERV